MPDPQTSDIVIENGRRIQRLNGAPDLDLGPADAQPAGPRGSLPRSLDFLLNPELASTATSLAADAVFPEERGAKLAARVGRHVLMPAAIAGGTSILNDLRDGNTDPKSVFGGALMHAGINAVPGAGGEVARSASRAPAIAADAMGGTLTGGVKGGIVGAIKSMLFGGESAPAIKSTVGGIADVTLPGGIKAASPQGVRFLEQELSTLQNQIKYNSTRVGPMGTRQTVVDPGMAARVRVLQRLIAEARTAASAVTPGQMLTKMGIPTGSLTADAASAATEAAMKKASTLAQRVRQILGISLAAGSEGNEALFGGEQ